MFKIAFSGAQNCGKTTKAHFFYFSCLRLGLNVELVEETARMCPYPLDNSADFKTQDWISKKQLELEKLAVSKNPDIVICDRSILDPLVYSTVLYENGKLSSNELNIIKARVGDWVRTYDSIVLCQVCPMVNDGLRYTNTEAQAHTNSLFDKIAKDFKLTNIRIA